VGGDIGNGDGMNVAMGFLTVVRLVGLPAELVMIRGEDAFCTLFLEGDAESADAAEEVNEAQGVSAIFLGIFPENRACFSPFGLFGHGAWLRLLPGGGFSRGFLSGHSVDLFSLEESGELRLSRAVQQSVDYCAGQRTKHILAH